MLDSIFTDRNTTDEFIVRTVFLYFIELMGISDNDSLEYMISFISKNTEEKKLLSLFEDKPEIAFDKLIFFSSDKKA